VSVVVPMGSNVLILAAVSSTTFLIFERTVSFAAGLVIALFLTAEILFLILVFLE